MESQPQNPEFRINPENFHTWVKELCTWEPFQYGPLIKVTISIENEYF